MADEPKDKSPNQSNIPPAPAGPPAPAADPAKPDAPLSESRLQPEPLSDGTVPTVLKPGETRKPTTKGVASLTKVYRRADILTTLFTLGGALLAAALIVGIYWWFNRSKPVTTPPVTNLSKEDLSKLDSFFGGNTAGNSSQVLTISSSTLFNNRVAVSSDLKVVGGLQVSGTTALADLTVDKASTLSTTTVRGALTVAGPLNLQSPAILSNGATVTGNVTASGNGSFGGTLSAGLLNIRDLTVTGLLSINGHLAISGLTPSSSAGSEAGSGATTSIEGNDASGTITINTGTIPPNISNPGGLLGVVTFRNAYPRAPRVVITPVGQNGAKVQPYVIKNANSFTIGIVNDAANNTSYTFDYWVVQ